LRDAEHRLRQQAEELGSAPNSKQYTCRGELCRPSLTPWPCLRRCHQNYAPPLSRISLRGMHLMGHFWRQRSSTPTIQKYAKAPLRFVLQTTSGCSCLRCLEIEAGRVMAVAEVDHEVIGAAESQCTGRDIKLPLDHGQKRRQITGLFLTEVIAHFNRERQHPDQRSCHLVVDQLNEITVSLCLVSGVRVYAAGLWGFSLPICSRCADRMRTTGSDRRHRSSPCSWRSLERVAACL
jgi:hypothetical protein